MVNCWSAMYHNRHFSRLIFRANFLWIYNSFDWVRLIPPAIFIADVLETAKGI